MKTLGPRIAAQHGIGVDIVVLADGSVLDDDGASANARAGTDRAVWPDNHILLDDCTGGDGGGRMHRRTRMDECLTVFLSRGHEWGPFMARSLPRRGTIIRKCPGSQSCTLA